MIYLLDTNVIIDANRDYYPMDRVPEFWDWLIEKGNHGVIKIPNEMFFEISIGTDKLAEWIKGKEIRDSLILDEEVNSELLSRIINEGYGSDLSDIEVADIGRDPFLIAYALNSKEPRVVVTTETSKPSRSRGKRKIPDVCKDFDISCINTYELIKQLDFSTNWKSKPQ